MNKSKLIKEGEKWVNDGLISEEQLQNILAKYEQKDRSYLLIIFAALLTSIGILIFIFSDWAQISDIVKIVVMLLIMVVFYGIGMYLFDRDEIEKETYSHSHIIGISFIVLGYIMFGATLLLTLYMYNIQLYSAWPFIIWSIVGLLLYFVTPNQYLFTLALLITIYGQLHSWLNYSLFDFIIFAIFIFGYFHFVFHRGNIVYHYIFVIGLALQLLALSQAMFDQFYWYTVFVLAMYVLAQLIPKDLLKNRMTIVAIFAILIYKLYESTIIQDEYMKANIVYEPLFFISLVLLLVISAFLHLRAEKVQLVTLLLFIPFFALPYGHIYIIISLFIYALFWLIYGFQRNNDRHIFVGTVSFLFSTFNVYIQYAWETLNKSLFFLVAGILLFIVSLIFERRRRKQRNGGEEK